MTSKKIMYVMKTDDSRYITYKNTDPRYSHLTYDINIAMRWELPIDKPDMARRWPGLDVMVTPTLIEIETTTTVKEISP